MKPSLGIEPGSHWWEANALLTTTPSLPSIITWPLTLHIACKSSIDEFRAHFNYKTIATQQNFRTCLWHRFLSSEYFGWESQSTAIAVGITSRCWDQNWKHGVRVLLHGAPKWSSHKNSLEVKQNHFSTSHVHTCNPAISSSFQPFNHGFLRPPYWKKIIRWHLQYRHRPPNLSVSMPDKNKRLKK